MRLFSPVERLLAKRYMRSRRTEGFISVIAWFSLAGITLGVATLIIVMSVMNGFRAELIGRILGLNGHVGVYAAGGSGIADFDPLSVSLAEIHGVIAVTPQVEGQVMASRGSTNLGAVVRGVRWSDLAARRPLWNALSDEAIRWRRTASAAKQARASQPTSGNSSVFLLYRKTLNRVFSRASISV